MTLRVGRYLLFDEFARGGMATVHFGRLDGSGGFKRIVAIKRLNEEAAGDQETRASIQDEALITSRIVHRNVVQMFDVVEAGGSLLLVMEYVHGLSLSVLIREARGRQQLIPAQVATAIVADALEGLQAAHEATDAEGKPLEIVHRDMSPHNVLVGADGVARVLDFGIAKARVNSQHTTPGLLKGKAAYMAPEQIHGKATASSDIFSTGLILQEALTGSRAVGPFETDGEALAAILLGKIKPLGEVRPELPAALVQIVERALAREASARFASARQMADALRTWGTATPDEVARWVNSMAGKTLEHRRALVRKVEASKEVDDLGVSPRRRLPLPALIGSAVAVALVGGLVVGSYLRRAPAAQLLPAVENSPAPNSPAVQDAGLSLTAAAAEPAPSHAEPDTANPPAATRPAASAHRPPKRQRSTAAKDCDPPFRIDKNGHKQFKAECF